MDKSLILVDGALAADSFLRTQLGLSSMFDFRVGPVTYREILVERMLKRLPAHRFLLTERAVCDFSVQELRHWLETEVPNFRDFANIFLYPAHVYFEDSPELNHVIERSVGSQDVIRLGLQPDMVNLPVRLLDDLRHQQRKITSLEAEFQWTVKSRLYNLENAFDLFTVYRLSSDSRFFNAFEFHGAYIKKSSQLADKARREFYFLSHVPVAVRPFFPQLGQCDDSGYMLEYIPCFDLSRHLIHGNLTPIVLDRFFQRLDRYLNACPVRDVGREAVRRAMVEMFIKKVDDRVSQALALPKFTALEAQLRLIWPLGLANFHAKLKQELLRKIEAWNTGELSLSHGDLCLSNILFDCGSGLLKLVDPRGASSEEECYLPAIYDLAKLSHSFLGGYELIKNQMVQMSFDQALNLRVRHDLPNEYLLACQKRFRQWLESRQVKISDVRLAEASLFLSMIPLHQDRPLHQLLMFRQAVAAFEDSLQMVGES